MRPTKTVIDRSAAAGLPVLALLLAPAAASAKSGAANPAGGAAIGEVVAATAGALVLTSALVAVGFAHRTGRISFLRNAAERTSRLSGLPSWAALPTPVATVSLLVALLGMYWDISLHIDQGRDPGPLANPAHYLILAGLFGVFAAGFLAVVLPDRRPSRSAVRVRGDWYAPVGGVVLLACGGFALMGFPLDDIWHRLFGQDVTLWGPTHLMLIGGAGLSLLGNAILLVEAGKPAVPETRTALVDFFVRTRYAGMIGGLLIGLSTFQGEFDFGVPQFRLLFQPILIAFAAGIALVAARIYGGRGGALIAAVYFLAIRGGVSLIVGPVLGETTPHFPLYLVEAGVVELAAFAQAPGRIYRFGALAGLLVGTVGTASEWGWSHIWVPIPWPESMLGATAIAAPLTGLAAGVVGAFVGTALGAPRRKGAGIAPALAPAAAGLAVIAAVIGYGLDTRAASGVRAAATLTDARPAPKREVMATVRIRPPSAATDADWLTITAWQGGGLVVDRLRKVGSGVYRTTRPIPVYGDWKSTLRLHKDDSILGAPVYMPEDRAIPAKGVPASPRFERAFIADQRLLQREKKRDVPSALPLVGYGAVLVIALSLIAALGWALLRLARSATAAAPSAGTPPPGAPAIARGRYA